jgi:hypothetical protein
MSTLRVSGIQLSSIVSTITNVDGDLEYFRFDSTNSPKLAINFTDIDINADNFNVNVNEVAVTGTLIATSIVESSDIKIKENVITISNALDKILQLRGVKYNLKSTGQDKIGLIAQEVESIIPEVVYDDGSIKHIAYGNLVGLLIEAIKELNYEICQLKIINN